MAIVCPLCPQDACCHFTPKSPDPFIKKDADMTPAKFGHLNHIIDMLCCISDDVAALESGSVQSVVYCGETLAEVAGVVTIPALEVAGDITGTGCELDPLTVTIPITSIEQCGAELVPVAGVVTILPPEVDGVTITGTGCVGDPLVAVAVPSGSACPYESNADYPGIPLGRAATFALFSGAAMTIGFPAQIVTGDIGYLGAVPADLIGTPLIVSGNGYGSTSAQTGQANYANAADTDATALYGILSVLVGGALPASLSGGASGTITPGTYGTIAGVAMTTAADTNIVLDGEGCYIFIGPSLATGANNTITLINGAKASDVYFVTSGTSDLAADNIWKGTLLSVGAVTTGAHTTLEGRAISTTGAVSIGAGNANGTGAYFVPLS